MVGMANTPEDVVDPQVAAAYVRDLFDVREQLAALRARYMPPVAGSPTTMDGTVGWRSITSDLDTIMHLESMREDGSMVAVTAEQALADMVTAGVQPCVNDGEDYLWEWQSERVSDWFSGRYPELTACCGAYTTFLDPGDGSWVHCCRACKDEVPGHV